MKQTQVQPELEDIIQAIKRYTVVNKSEVSFVGSFIAFDMEKMGKGDEDITKDNADRLFAYGDKETLLIQLHELMGMILESDEDFINI